MSITFFIFGGGYEIEEFDIHELTEALSSHDNVDG